MCLYLHRGVVLHHGLTDLTRPPIYLVYYPSLIPLVLYSAYMHAPQVLVMIAMRQGGASLLKVRGGIFFQGLDANRTTSWPLLNGLPASLLLKCPGGSSRRVVHGRAAEL